MLGGFNAWYLGAKSLKPDITAIIAFTDSWINVAAEEHAVQQMMDLGCDGNLQILFLGN